MSAIIKYVSQILTQRDSKPQFFREDGLRKIDFDFGYYIERPEEHAILHGIFKRIHHVIVGKPASGKTSLLRRIGYLLNMKNYHNVVYINAGVISHVNKYLIIQEIEDIFNAHNESLIILFDDIHKSFEPSNEVANFIVSKNIRCIFATRPSFRHYIDVKIENTLIKLIKNNQSCLTELMGENIEDSILSNLFKSFGKKPEDSQISRIKKISAGDLWIFGFLLNSYDDISEIEISIVQKQILQRIESKEKESTLLLSKAIAFTSLFGKFEIPLLYMSLEKIFSKEIVNYLISDSLLELQDKYVSFYHSSIADLYVKSLQYGDIYITTNEEYDLAEVTNEYLKLEPNEMTLIFKRLCLYPKIIEKLLERKYVCDAINLFIDDDKTTLSHIADFITDACRQGNNKIANKITTILENRTEKIIQILNKEKDIHEINFFLGSIPWLIKHEYSETAEKLSFLMKSQIEDGLLTDNQCVYQILAINIDNTSSNNDIRQITELFPTFDNLFFNSTGCSRYAELEDPFLCLKSSICYPSEFNKNLIQLMDEKILLNKLQSNDFYKAIKLIHTICWIEKSIAYKLLENLLDTDMPEYNERKKMYIKNVISLKRNLNYRNDYINIGE